MPFFEYYQNNSGGRFMVTENLTRRVIVEAHDAPHADLRLTQLGGYFDGCATGSDCDCCGDRWYRAYDDGDPEPPVLEVTTSSYFELPAGKQIVIHYLNGETQWF